MLLTSIGWGHGLIIYDLKLHHAQSNWTLDICPGIQAAQCFWWLPDPKNTRLTLNFKCVNLFCLFKMFTIYATYAFSFSFFFFLETYMNKSRLESGECHKRPSMVISNCFAGPFTPIPQNCEISISFLLLENKYFLRSRLHNSHFLDKSMSDPSHLTPCHRDLPFLAVGQFWL